MAESKTASRSKNMFGQQPYQIKAREALPILIRQALAREPIYYEALAKELGMPNPRNLNFPLGSIGQTLIELGNRQGDTIPPIQSLVVNQAHRTPGEGFDWFLTERNRLDLLSKDQRHKIFDRVNQDIYAYPYWQRVLRDLGLGQTAPVSSAILKDAATYPGGEGQNHRDLKIYVSSRPQIVGLPKRTATGSVEKLLPSGDAVDVVFSSRDEWVGVEVKPRTAPDHDLLRGLFQCVKYQAVLKALALAQGIEIHVRCVLVTGGQLPDHLVPLRNMLGFQVIENVSPLSDI